MAIFQDWFAVELREGLRYIYFQFLKKSLPKKHISDHSMLIWLYISSSLTNSLYYEQGITFVCNKIHL